MSNYEWITGMGPGELAAFLELVDGSRRKKNGEPVLPKRTRVKVSA